MLKKKLAKRLLAKVMIGVLSISSLAVAGDFLGTSSVIVKAEQQWSSSTVYTGGQTVEYNGSIYRAQWWTQGDEPGKNSVWVLVSSGSNPGGNPGGENPTTGNSGSTISGGNATEVYNPVEGKNIQGVSLPGNYYDKKVVGYFPNYAINSEAHEKFSIADLQWDVLTHVQYAFGVVNKDTCELEAGDIENDINNKFTDRKFYHDGVEIKMDESLGYYGQFNLMHTLKKMHPNVKVLISTGGWGASEGLWYATKDTASMNKFADSAVRFIRKYGFDGIDIDFEFPSETPQSGNYTNYTESIRSGISDRYTQFIKILSEKLSAAAKEDHTYYWLTSAVSASSWVLGGQTNSSFLDYLDFVSIMSYDYHGGWNNFVENQANLFADPDDGETAQMAVKTLGFDWSKNFYRGKVQSEKILMGVPYYTRGWTNVQGGTNGLHGRSGNPLTNATDGLNKWCDLDANGNEVAAGANPLWHVMNVMKENGNYKKYWDNVGKVPHIWNAQNNTFLTFEDTQSVQERINMVNNDNLGGVLIWVMHGDYDYNNNTGKYEVGDTLTSMFYNQFKAAGPSKVTSDIDYNNSVLDFDVNFGGKYDHPNYTYAIDIKNNTSTTIPAGFKFSFKLPKSAEFKSSWGGDYSVKKLDGDFNEITLTSQSALEAKGSVTLQGMIVCCFSAAKDFKINGLSQASEVNNEIKRLNNATLTEKNGTGEVVTQKPTQQATTVQPTTQKQTTQQVTTQKQTTQQVTTQKQTTQQVTTQKQTTVQPTTQKQTTQQPTTQRQTTQQVTTQRQTTQQTTTASQNHDNVKVGVDGFQISTKLGGFRTIYSIENENEQVDSVGLIYGLADYADADNMLVGVNSPYIKQYEATAAGKNTLLSTNTVSKYTMTMLFIDTKEFYSTNLRVRAYVKFRDGSVKYSTVNTTSVYDIADYLYDNNLMSNELNHDYLYNNILKVVNNNYAYKKFDWNKSVVLN